MHAPHGIEPIAVNHVTIWIEASEEAFGDGHLPHVVLDARPSLDDFGPGEDDVLARRGLVDDSKGVGRAAARR